MRHLAARDARNILLWKNDPMRHRRNFEIFCLVLLCAFVPFTEPKQTTGDFNPKTLAESLLLFHKIVTLVQNKDPKLAKSITDARQSLWKWLSDPNTSVKL